jgi:hypothetical protein
MTDVVETKEVQGGGIMATLEKKIQQATGYPNMLMILRSVSEYTAKIPDTVSMIAGPTAHELAANFLKGHSLCADLCAIAEQYEAKSARNKKTAYAEAFFEAMPKYKTQKERECYAEINAHYLEVADEHDQAVMFRVLIENKRDDLEKAHYFMRKIAEAEKDSPFMGSSKSNGGEPRRFESGRVAI